MGALKSKANSTSCAEASTPQSEPTPKADFPRGLQRKDVAPKPKDVAPSAEPMNLPTKSWRALLNDQPMNKDAKPFCPGSLPVPVQPPPPRNLPPTTLAGSTSAAAEEDPEWMKYLSKKLDAAGSPQKPATTGKGGDSGVKFQKVQECSDGPSGNIVIHTESYLQMLKDGSSKKKKRTPGTTTASVRKQRETNEIVATGAIQPTNSSTPMTTSSLAKKWSGAVNRSLPIGEATEEVVEEGAIQDDMWIEKLLFDQDLSDPAYYSESEPTNTKTSASVHRMRRRPQLAKAVIRSYVMQDLNFYLDQVVGMTLLRLQRFTEQQNGFLSIGASDSGCEKQVQVQQPRRFVIGLKEVARRTKQSKVKCLIIAPDIEEDSNSGGLDDRMRELLASAYQSSTPVIFALSRARLGKALGKQLHISVLGILDAKGAQNLLNEAVQQATRCQQSWLAQLEK